MLAQSPMSSPSRQKQRGRPSRWKNAVGFVRRTAPRIVVVSALVYLAGLGAAAFGLAVIGESWWMTTLGLYVPVLLIAAPWPFVLLALRHFRQRRQLWIQLLALPLLLFLFGFVAPWPTGEDAGPKLRFMSFNVDSGYAGYDAIASAIVEQSPDVVVVQEAFHGPEQLAEKLKKHYAHTHFIHQFVIASRFPILAATDPERIEYFGRERSPRFMRYVIASPLGELAVFSVHPVSPRGILGLYRYRQVVELMKSKALFSLDPEEGVEGNTGLRLLQLEAISRLAALEKRPVVIAGDFNLPGLSPAFRKNFGDYADGFREASWGFGYTFPSKYPWLRLDRVLVSHALAFQSFEVGCKELSDHRCVVSDIRKKR
jgi:vancomycin resistance protein VanJ